MAGTSDITFFTKNRDVLGLSENEARLLWSLLNRKTLTTDQVKRRDQLLSRAKSSARKEVERRRVALGRIEGATREGKHGEGLRQAEGVLSALGAGRGKPKESFTFVDAVPGVRPRVREGTDAAGASASGGTTGSGGSGSGGGGGGGAPATAGAPTVSDQDVLQFIEDNYPQYAWLVANPDIKALFQQAMSEDWDDRKIVLELRKTDWFRTTSESVRQWEALKSTDPATANQRMQQQGALLHDAAARLGVDISPEAFGRLVENSLRFGWVPEQVDDALVNFATFTGGTSAGALQKVKGLASDYGVLMGDQAQKDWARRFLLGEVDEEGLVADFVERAKSMYAPDGKGFVAAGLDAGRTTRQIMDGYIQVAAQDLEINPEAVDITDSKWSRPLLQVDAEGNRTPLSIYDWRQLIRSDDTYGFKGTKLAQDKAESFAHSLARTLGAVA